MDIADEISETVEWAAQYGVTIDKDIFFNLSAENRRTVRLAVENFINGHKEDLENQAELARRITDEWSGYTNTNTELASLFARQYGDWLPAKSRTALYEPFAQDLINEFIADLGTIEPIAAGSTRVASTRLSRVRRDLRTAMFVTWYEIAKQAGLKSLIWLISAFAGDQAVRMLNQLFQEVWRRS